MNLVRRTRHERGRGEGEGGNEKEVGRGQRGEGRKRESLLDRRGASSLLIFTLFLSVPQRTMLPRITTPTFTLHATPTPGSQVRFLFFIIIVNDNFIIKETFFDSNINLFLN